ncbi:enoyl-CoA hydratase-related protein [Pseudonocardia kongjuensis]|uniref:Enoyl-CoA hydratase-related protein n=1 Tax=Pseudonocardia kongjuensis TaxID=102227 RepID=A0ABN1XL46_9PSEU
MTDHDRSRAVPDGAVLDVGDDGVAVLTLDRPQRRNALHRPLLDGLPGLVAALDADPAVRVIVLTGRGGAFCAGGDLDVIGALGDEPPERARARMAREFSTTVRLVRATTPTLAAVDGAAVGAGAALALACDLRIGSPSAFLAVPFVRMALVPDWGISRLLSRAVGPGRATEIALSARRVGAAEALRIGLLDEIADDPLAAALERAAVLAATPPEAARRTVALIHDAADATVEEAVQREITEQIAQLASPESTRMRAEWSAEVRRR